jgi:hypothetical protein
MTTPTVIELPLHLEPTTPDSFLDVPGSAAAAPVIRELDRRRSDGIDVRLLWNQTDDQVMVAVFDAKTGDAFQIRSPRTRKPRRLPPPLRVRGLPRHRAPQANEPVTRPRGLTSSRVKPSNPPQQHLPSTLQR